MSSPATATPPERQEEAPPAAEAVLSFRNLSVHYGKVRALDGLSADVPAGAVGLLGPNGAGKTTLIKVLLGLQAPTGGDARVAGLDPGRKAEKLELRRLVGYMPESDCLIPERTGVELVVTLGRVTGMSAADAMTRAHEVLDYVGLEEQRYRRLDQYSTGMKQRLKLAQALVHDPSFLLLDEPTNGLDPRGRRHMLELIADLGRTHGKNLLLCSHLLPDVERTCDHVVVIHRGKVVEAGDIAVLTRAEERRIDIEVQGPVSAFEGELGRAGLGFEAKGRGRFSLLLSGGVPDADGVFVMAERSGCRLMAVEPVWSSLEQVFLRVLHDADEART